MADRGLSKNEYIQALDLMGGNGGTVLNRLKFLAMIKFQLHLICRNDDIAHVSKDCIQRSPQFPQFMTVRMKWSKNVREERDCPPQIIVGAMDHRVCVVLAMSLYLEKWIKEGAGATSQWVFTDGTTDSRSTLAAMEKETERGKKQYSDYFKKYVVDNPLFVKDHEEDGKIGTHSIRKFATTFCRQSGVSKYDTDYRARRKERRMQDRYTDSQLHWPPDINAVSRLSIGGICLYKPIVQSGITDEWLAHAVAPHIANVFGNGVAAILAKPLLWACMEEESMIDLLVPADIKRDVVAAFVQLQSAVPDGTNPIERVEVIASELVDCCRWPSLFVL